MQTRCIVKASRQKSPLFWRFSGGFCFSQDRLLFRNSTRKPLNLIKSPIFTNAPCKTTCLYNAPSMHTVDFSMKSPNGPIFQTSLMNIFFLLSPGSGCDFFGGGALASILLVAVVILLALVFQSPPFKQNDVSKQGTRATLPKTSFLENTRHNRIFSIAWLWHFLSHLNKAPKHRSYIPSQ